MLPNLNPNTMNEDYDEGISPETVKLHYNELVDNYTNSESFKTHTDLEKEDRMLSYRFLSNIISAIKEDE